ncbi:hypothetical protein HK104_004432 [Borealophlyctis nickersoniae]|nr:hypothetical protein HK104_004432 [Borealophlyctis nickersoniae]
MIPLSTRRYLQLDTLEELNVIVSRSGKYDVVATHDVSTISKFRKRQKHSSDVVFEVNGLIAHLNCVKSATAKTSVYLCVAMPRSIIVLKWAPHPFNKFMKVKEVSTEFKVNSMDITESGNGDLRLYVGMPLGFKMINLQAVTAEDVSFPELSEQKLGLPVRGILFNESFILCYESSDYLVAGSSAVVDVINSETGKIVHVFETKKDKIRSLELLVSKGDRLFLLAEEDKDNIKTSSIIMIEWA